MVTEYNKDDNTYTFYIKGYKPIKCKKTKDVEMDRKTFESVMTAEERNLFNTETVSNLYHSLNKIMN